jgi:hypothetical protein
MKSFFLGNWVTRSYIVAVVVVAVSSAAPLAKICLIALVAPVTVIFASIYLLGTGWMTGPMVALGVTAGVLLNMLLLSTPSWMAPPGSAAATLIVRPPPGKGQV